MTEITVVGAGGEYMESVVVVEWHKKPGERVEVGETVVTVETAKAATDIEAPASGVLAEIRAEVGQEIEVGGVLGIIGDDVAAVADSQLTAAPQPPSISAEQPPAPSAPCDGGKKRVVASPLARRVAAQRNIDLAGVVPSSPSRRIKLRDLETHAVEAPQAVGTAAMAVKRQEGARPPVPASAGKAGNLHLQSRGNRQGDRIVFLHGFGSDGPSWQPLLAALGSDFNAILVDLPGHGRSPLPQHGPSVNEMAEAVALALDDAGIDDFHLIAHSLGGAIALVLAARGRHAIRSLTLIAPAGLGPDINGGFVSGLVRATRPESLAPWLSKLFHDASLASPAFVAATMQARFNASLRDAQTHIAEAVFPDGTQAADLRHVIKGIAAPLKIVWGEQDRIIPMQHALGTGGLAALHFLPGVGHMPQIEAVEAVARLVMQNIRAAS
ncbi:MAG: acetoin dehydrogenase dihydrolipoyllysine-residue acetyltransferase subunit [Mesorhizobium sp.]